MTLDALTPASVHSLWSSPKCLNRLCLTVFSSLWSSLLLVHIFLTNLFLPVNFAFNMLWYSIYALQTQILTCSAMSVHDVMQYVITLKSSCLSVYKSNVQIHVKCRLQKNGVTTQRVYKVKQRCRRILNLEKMRWSLCQAWPFQHKSGTRITKQVSIWAYKAYKKKSFR